MLRFFFWNIGRKQIHDLVALAAVTFDADVIILAEHEGITTTLLRALNQSAEEIRETWSYPPTAGTTIQRTSRQGGKKSARTRVIRGMEVGRGKKHEREHELDVRAYMV